MRLECPHCGETVEPSEVAVDPASGQIRFRCPECGRLSAETVRIHAREQAPTASGIKEAGAEGVADGSAPASRASPDATGSAEDTLWAAWDRVTARFDEDAPHQAFLATCEAMQALPFAAARYREWADAHPEDARARRQLTRVAALAQVVLLVESRRAGRAPDPLRRVVVLGAVLLALVVVAVLLAPVLLRGLGGEAQNAARTRGARPRLQNLARPRPPGPPPRAAPGQSERRRVRSPAPSEGARPVAARRPSSPRPHRPVAAPPRPR